MNTPGTLLASVVLLLVSAQPSFAQQQTLSCWYDSSGRYTGADSSEGTVGSIDRTGSGDYAAGYLISAFDGTACPRSLPAAATRGTTGYLVRQDFSSCTNDDVRATATNTAGAASVFRMPSGPAKVVVRVNSAAPNTTYHFFHKCVRILGDIRTDARGNGVGTFDISPATGAAVAFDMYPEGAPAGNKYQSVRVTF